MDGSCDLREGPGLRPCHPGTGAGFALESSDSSGEKDHDGPFGGCPTWIFGYSQHDNMQFKSVRITSNLMAPSRALDAAHVLLYRGAVTKRLRSGCDDSSLPNYKSIPPTWAPNSWTDQIRSNTILVAPLIFALAVNWQYLQRLQGHQFFFWQDLIGSVPPAVGTHHWNANWWQAVPRDAWCHLLFPFFWGAKSQRLRWYSFL